MPDLRYTAPAQRRSRDAFVSVLNGNEGLALTLPLGDKGKLVAVRDDGA